MTGTREVACDGELDLLGVEQLARLIDDALGAEAATRLVLDMASVLFADLDGLDFLVETQRRCDVLGVHFVLRSVPPSIRQLLTLTQAHDQFDYDDPIPGPADNDLLPATTRYNPEPDPRLDRVAGLIQRVLHVPTALVSLVDQQQQVFPGAAGLPADVQQRRFTPLSHSFCQHVVQRAAPLVVDDANTDSVLRTNPAISDLGVVAYAGMPLTDLDGHVIGALCAIDSSPRHWTKDDLEILRDLASMCSTELQLRSAISKAQRRLTAASATGPAPLGDHKI